MAVACAIALHEIIAALLPSLAPRPSDVRETVEHVTIARVERTPTPTPRPTPTPPPRHTILIAQPHAEGKAARAAVVKRMGAPRVQPPKIVHAKPIWDIAVATPGQGAGAGAGEGAGNLGNGTNGTGAGESGSGAGGGGAPCGAVDFVAKGEAQFNAASGFYERDNIVAVLHYADGTSDSVPLDWAWRFKSEDLDPFNTRADAPMFFQFPPLSQRASEPPQVQWIMKNTTSFGGTKLNDQCANIPPPPTPPHAP